jgi:hypothetical protein
MLTGAIIGVVVAVTLTLVNRSRARSGSGLPGQIEQALRGRGALTLKEVAVLMGRDSFFGRGEVGQALAALSSVGKVRTIPAPDGTPQLKKVQFIKYERVDRTPPT